MDEHNGPSLRVLAHGPIVGRLISSHLISSKSQFQSPPTMEPCDSEPPPKRSSPNGASRRLVYVRRRVEVQPKEPTAQGPSTSSSSHPLGWEERYHRLQMLLNKLDESDQTDHVQMLWSLSPAELSMHAVELEKRSIQFSLEEAREMQRVAALNVLGKSLKSTSNDG